MTRMPRAIAAIAVASMLSAGCSLVQPRMTEDGLAKVSSRGPGALYMKPGHSAGSYDNIMVAKIGIDYAPDQEPLSEAIEQAIFDRMVFGLQNGVDTEFNLALSPGPCTLQLGLYLTRLRFYDHEVSGSQTSFVNSYGEATLVFEFRDSVTDEALVRYGQSSSLGSGVEGGASGPDIDRLNRTLDRMLLNVGRKLQEVVPVDVAARSEQGCNGAVGKAVLEAQRRAGR